MNIFWDDNKSRNHLEEDEEMEENLFLLLRRDENLLICENVFLFRPLPIY